MRSVACAECRIRTAAERRSAEDAVISSRAYEKRLSVITTLAPLLFRGGSAQ
jgi:hypothetical protein